MYGSPTQEAAVKAVSERAEEEKSAAIEEVCESLKADHQRQLQEQEREFNNHLAAMHGQLTVSSTITFHIIALSERSLTYIQWK